MLKKLACIGLGAMIAFTLSGCDEEKEIKEYNKESNIKILNENSKELHDDNISLKNDIKIDDELVQIIMQNLKDNSHEVPLNNEKIYQYKYSELETGELWEYLFDIDNDGIEDKIKIDYGTAVSFCEIFFGIDNTTYIRGNYSGGIYDETTPLSERDETEGQIGHLEFFRYKDYNYILDSSTTTANYEIRLYHNKELVDVVNIRNTKNKEYSVTVCKESDLEEVLKSEGEKILKEDECNYPYLHDGTGEEGGDTDINNDGEIEKIYKTQSGGLNQFFHYGINGEIDSKYFENLGLCKDTLYGFWIDKINNINVLKMIEYDWDNDIAYFRCYIVKSENADLIFEMQRKDNLTFKGIRNTDMTSEGELEIKIKEYIDALNPWRGVATSIPEFSNINEANKYWIRDCMRMYFRKNYDQTLYYGPNYELHFRKEAEKIKDILFGKEFTNYEYIEPEITGDAYDMQRTYIKSVEKIGELYKVTTIPYKVFDSVWEDVRELNYIDIYDLTETKVYTLTYTDKENDDFKQVEDKIEQYVKENEQKFAKQILEIKLDNETGNLHIVSSKIASR